MSDVLEIEVAGEPPPARRSDAPEWGLPAAIAVAGMLFLAVVMVVNTQGHRPAPSTATQEPSVTVLPTGHDEVLDATRAALSAWGRFGVTGDIALLTGHFDELGPQYRQLAAEAPAIAARPAGNAYEVNTGGEVESYSPFRARVAATVVWRRDGEADQKAIWSVDLRRASAGASWVVWTVRPVDGRR